MEICFAKVLSGHDRNQIYMISQADETYVSLVNGENKTLAAPKKKSKKHIQIIRKLPDAVIECMAIEVTDVTIKRAIKIYRNLLENKEGGV